ncbi:MAG TPA: branched-chain amino acid ABC transporter permease [Thermodesulfobacteriota bacterium]|nr:branched-chain amino acid ABC transporter permease [Thermodesulfobacteriota bacterium]
MDFEIILQIIVSGLLMGLIFALIAVGLTLVWGVMDILNFAHGEFLMVAMFISFWMFSLWNIDPLWSIPITVAALFGMGVLTYRLIIKKVLNAPGLTALLATFGLSILIKNLAQFFWSPDFRHIQGALLSDKGLSIFGLHLSLAEVVAAGGSGLITFAIYYLIFKTKTGRAIRATALDRDTALLMGINIDRIFALTFGLGGACVGVAGALLMNFYYVFPSVGSLFGILAFVTVALGGFGNITGAFLAGIIIGVVETAGGVVIAPVFKYTVVFGMYLVIILIRPKGLFGW